MKNFNCDELEIINADEKLLSSIEFDCSDDDLNEFLLKDSIININNSLSSIYLFVQ